MYEFIATFKGVKGRYAVNRIGGIGCGYEGQKILNARQLKYGNQPNEQGMWLNEMTRLFSAHEVVSLKPIK